MEKIIESLENTVKMASVLVDKERKHLNTLITELRAKVGATGYPFSSKVEAQTYFKAPLRNEKHFVAENLGNFAFDANCKLLNEISNADGARKYKYNSSETLTVGYIIWYCLFVHRW